MPVRRVGKNCYQWGHHGKRYCGPGARQKAERQGRAAYSHGYRGQEMRERPEDIWYSGSPQRFDRFHRRIGHTFGTDASEVPIFLTRDPKFAELYAGANGYVYTVHPNVERTFNARSFVISDRYWPPPREALTEEGQKFFDDLVENRIFPELIRYGTKHEDDDEWATMHDSSGTYASIFRRDYDVMETTEMKRWMIAHGYDSFFVSGDGPDDNLAVFDPEKIEIVSVVALSDDAQRSGLKLKESSKPLTDTQLDVLRLIAEGREIGDYVPRYRPGAQRGRGAFPTTIAARAAAQLVRMGLVERGGRGYVLTRAGMDALVAIC